MEGHIHLSLQTALQILAVMLIGSYFLRLLAVKLASSNSEGVSLWGQALGVFVG